MNIFQYLLLCSVIAFQIMLTPMKGKAAEKERRLYPSETVYIHDSLEAVKATRQLLPELQTLDLDLILRSVHQSPGGMHYRFSIQWHTYPVWQAYITVHCDAYNRLLLIQTFIPFEKPISERDISQQLSAFESFNAQRTLYRYRPEAYPVKEKQWVLAFPDGEPTLWYQVAAWNTTLDEVLFFNAHEELQQEYNYQRHFGTDTTLYIKVFNPDPLSNAQQQYGGIYIDQNDANAAWMNPWYQAVSVRGAFNSTASLFYPENELVKIIEIESPSVSVVNSTSDQFLFDRSQSGFEDMNALYHLTFFHDYISSLGYDTLMKQQLAVDTHGQFGADNSVFNRNGGNPNLIFGIGGVDDAEDADVIIHEYSHALSWSANKNGTFSNERSALDEGLADYFATSYSRNLQPFHWDSMFTWDGHNEFWSGRSASSPEYYPSQSPDIYRTGAIWNAAMSAIWGDVGRTVTDKLMLETLHYLNDQTSLPLAALYVLQSDSILFGGIHTASICKRFRERRILNDRCTPFTEAELKNSVWQFIQVPGATENIVWFPDYGDGSCRIVDLTGRTLSLFSFQDTKSLTIDLPLPARGVYIAQIRWKDEWSDFS